MASDPNYLPYLDDSMSRSLGNVDYAPTVKQRNQRNAELDFTNVLRHHTYPYYEQNGLPVGGALRKKKIRKLKKKISSKYLKKRGFPITKKKMTKKLAKRGIPKYVKKVQKRRMKKGKGLIVARGAIPPMIKPSWAAGEALAASPVNMPAPSREYIPARPAGGFLGTAALASIATPIAMEGLRWVAKKIGEKLSSKGEGMKKDPMISKAKKKMRKAQKKSMKSAILAKGKSPRGSRSFWLAVYKLVKKEIPVHFKNKTAAIAAASDFVKEHKKLFFGSLANYIKKTKDEKKTKKDKTLTVGHVLKPLIKATAAEEGIPIAEVKPLLAHPKMTEAAGYGITDTIMSIVKSPEVRGLVGQAAKTLLPKVTTKLSSLFKGSKFAKKHPSVASIGEKAIQYGSKQAQKIIEEKVSPSASEISATPASETIEVPSEQPAGSGMSYTYNPIDAKRLPLEANLEHMGPATADMYPEGGRMATKVYAIAKK